MRWCLQAGLTCLKTVFSAKVAPPPPPAQPRTPPPSYGASSSAFKFGRPESTAPTTLTYRMMNLCDSIFISAGFGNRFGKPKGPRTYPETWVWGSRPSLNIKDGAFLLTMSIRTHWIAKGRWSIGSLAQVSLDDTAEDQIQWTWKALTAVSLCLAQQDLQQRTGSALFAAVMHFCTGFQLRLTLIIDQCLAEQPGQPLWPLECSIQNSAAVIIRLKKWAVCSRKRYSSCLHGSTSCVRNVFSCVCVCLLHEIRTRV